MKFSERLDRFLQGRYGGDPLNTVISIAALVGFGKTACTVISIGLYVISAGGIGYSFFRMLSRDLTARKAEYDKYRKKVVEPLMRTRSELKTRSKQRKTHKFFKCPKCRQTVRVPKGKGKVRITCPKCGEVFIKET